MTKCAVYVRISKETEGATLENQEKVCRALAKTKGWTLSGAGFDTRPGFAPITGRYVDDDKSAYSGTPRPAYDVMFAGFLDGTLDALVVYDIDRLYRLPRELEDLLDLTDPDVTSVKGKSVPTILYAAPAGYDLATSDGRFMARMMVNVANKSSADTRRRVRLALKANAVNGDAHGGLKTFGFQPGNVLHDEREAAEIRTTCANLISGASLRSECRRLDAAEAKGVTGANWQGSALRRVLLSARIIGKRSYITGGGRKGVAVLSDAVWKPIISEETQTLVRAALGQRTVGAMPSYLLAGILRCGVCGAKMNHQPQWKKNAATYVCPPRERGAPDRIGSQCVSVSASRVEAAVVAAVVARSEAPVIEKHSRRSDPTAALAASIVADRAELQVLGAGVANKSLSLTMAQAAAAGIEKRIADTERKLAAVPRAAANGGSNDLHAAALAGATFANYFASFDTDDQRAIIGRMVDHVDVAATVKPAARKGAKMRPVADRLSIRWRA
jgi:site-specific DNA recombinase